MRPLLLASSSSGRGAPIAFRKPGDHAERSSSACSTGLLDRPDDELAARDAERRPGPVVRVDTLNDSSVDFIVRP